MTKHCNTKLQSSCTLQYLHPYGRLCACRAALLDGPAAPDARRAALAAVHFPEHRTLAADEPCPADDLPADPSIGCPSPALSGHDPRVASSSAAAAGAPEAGGHLGGGAGEGGLDGGEVGGAEGVKGEAVPPVGEGARLGYSEAGYDPAFMLPFCVQVRDAMGDVSSHNLPIRPGDVRQYQLPAAASAAGRGSSHASAETRITA